jgi:hypothetical protein
MREDNVTKNRKIEKHVEIHEFYVMKTTSGSLPALCTECSAGDAFMLSPEQASTVTHVPLRMIYCWIETASIHFRETPNGSVIVCLKSLTITRNQIGEAE